MTNAGAAERIARELASNGHGPDAISAAEELASLLNLGDVGLTISGGRIVGTGSKASADVYLSNGTTIIFERFGDVANPTRLMTEVVTCTGAAPALSGPDARRAAALLRVVAEHEEADTIDHQARSWGLDYLQAADTRPFDINDQTSRWEAFAQLKTIDPVASNRHDPTRSVAAWSIVLVDLNGTRYVRLGWFADHVRTSEQISPADIAVRMQRVGWTRRGRGGRIKATQPDSARSSAGTSTSSSRAGRTAQNDLPDHPNPRGTSPRGTSWNLAPRSRLWSQGSTGFHAGRFLWVEILLARTRARTHPR